MISTKVGQLQQLYNYLSTNRPNQLSQVTDSETTSSNTDIEGTHSYLYDAIGNIVENNEPFGVTDITWDVYNKVRTTSSPYKNQSYFYDAMGNRVTTVAGMSSTFYIRDPQGNVLSLYKSQGNDPPSQAEAHIYGSSRHGMAMLIRTASAYQARSHLQ